MANRGYMKVNPFIWQNYKDSEQGKAAIKLFDDLNPLIYEKYLINYFLDAETIDNMVDELYHYSDYKEDYEGSAERIIHNLLEKGIVFRDENGTYDEISPNFSWYLDYIVPLSSWLYLLSPTYFKPYFFIHNADELIKISDSFGLELPPMPIKRNKRARFEYYFLMCQIFHDFEQENGFSPEEMCAFLYDFCPKYFGQQRVDKPELPEPTQAWFIGSNKQDFDFLDKFSHGDIHFWQGNVDTKCGDILVMYCLSPRSYIHSIWRAERDGIASPFFHWYSSIYIGKGQKISPIFLNDLKENSYFSENKLVRKNFQGVNGYALTADDYAELLNLIEKNGDNIENLPQLFAPSYQKNLELKNERDVEVELIEPLLKDIGKNKVWTRQLTVKMGRGERVFPDYALLNERQKGYEQASILLEAKYHIQSNQELEAAFRQVWSYGLRLSARLLIIADKNSLWLYEKTEQGFDRSRYSKFYWKTLEKPDEFKKIKILVSAYFE